jgi:metal-responsive CopG/Arc/MetJ family transcriptional regulator
MKEEISITLSKDVLERIDRLAGSKRARSSFIEGVLRRDLCQRQKAALTVSDLELINRAADRLNLEVAEVLSYQATAKRSVGSIP